MFLLFCLCIYSLKLLARPSSPKSWWSQVRDLIYIYKWLQQTAVFSENLHLIVSIFLCSRKNKISYDIAETGWANHTSFRSITCRHQLLTLCCYREPARPWQSSGLCEEAGSGPGWWRAHQRSVRNLGQPLVLLQASWSLCGEYWRFCLRSRCIAC